jgi:hypothetical protein
MNYPISYRVTNRGNEALHMSAHAMRQKYLNLGHDFVEVETIPEKKWQRQEVQARRAGAVWVRVDSK